MEEKHLFVIAKFDADTNRRLAGLYKTLADAGLIGTQTKGIPYHITLGTFDVAEEAEVVEHAKAAARSENAFTLRLAYIGLFGLSVLFIAPAVKHQLLNLRHAVVPGGESADEFPWVAHTTLLMDEPDAILRAIPIAAGHFTPFRATVESIGVYEFFPERKVGVYPLGQPG